MSKLLLALVLIGWTSVAQAQIKRELTPTPPMGWNSWNWFGKKDINEELIKKIIDTMVDEGLRDAGYNYVVIDGGWRDTKLGPNGELLPHPVKFPNGIKPLADYAHARNMKIGVHVVPGTHDCGGDLVGAIGHEEVHMQQFVDWELDFIKLDQCKFVNDPCSDCPKTKLGWSEPNAEEVYRKWSKLLYEADRDILFSISAYTYRDWYPEVCNMARTSLDIQSRIHRGGAYFNPPAEIKMAHMSVMGIVEKNNAAAAHAGNGYWNDPDMLATGVQGLSINEQEAHFVLWCMMSSPLFLGNDPRVMSKHEKQLILNKELIAINQDPTEQGKIIKREGNTQVWAKQLKNGQVAVMFLNLDTACEQEMTIDLKELGFKGSVKVRDLLKGKDLGEYAKSLSATAETNQCKVMLVSK
ncbi:glycoside hydrolase family 27 protein [Reichenbachiella carrageenanivorans]|uniref:Alpha-galactosidase n=1 Tax=Reichenbachiella carrageenanivorans TaxID=2979869 RepID=A0ABY6CWN0_9BACT|nr:glycoside hydrolase family 27 protein [Reichenbachiella carrageenanivorans]UXX78114.1 glycoside hydrolase family 27 protein [Reichenbachiella carrageenanivorans]